MLVVTVRYIYPTSWGLNHPDHQDRLSHQDRLNLQDRLNHQDRLNLPDRLGRARPSYSYQIRHTPSRYSSGKLIHYPEGRQKASQRLGTSLWMNTGKSASGRLAGRYVLQFINIVARS